MKHLGIIIFILYMESLLHLLFKEDYFLYNFVIHILVNICSYEKRTPIVNHSLKRCGSLSRWRIIMVWEYGTVPYIFKFHFRNYEFNEIVEFHFDYDPYIIWFMLYEKCKWGIGMFCFFRYFVLILYKPILHTLIQ